MDLHLQDKIVIVTGGGAGIGAGISLQLAREGAVPVILGRSALLPEFEAELRSVCPRFAFFQLELADEAACADAASTRWSTTPARMTGWGWRRAARPSCARSKRTWCIAT